MSSSRPSGRAQPPHGTVDRYRESCRCTPCTRANTETVASYRARRRSGDRAPRDRVDSAFVVGQLRRWARMYDTPEIAAATGLVQVTVLRLLTDPPSHVQWSTEQAVRDAVMPVPQWIPRARLHQRAFSLAALGYPISWQVRQAGILASAVHDDAPRVAFQTFARLDDLYREIKDLPAADNPACDQPVSRMQHARETAARRSYLTPDWYDDDGNKITARQYRANQVAAHKRERALRGIQVLRLILNGATNQQISEEMGFHNREAHRWRDDRARVSGHITDFGTWLPDKESLPRFKEIERAIDAYLGDPSADPRATLIKLGIVHTTREEKAELEMAS